MAVPIEDKEDTNVAELQKLVQEAKIEPMNADARLLDFAFLTHQDQMNRMD